MASQTLNGYGCCSQVTDCGLGSTDGYWRCNEICGGSDTTQSEKSDMLGIVSRNEMVL